MRRERAGPLPAQKDDQCGIKVREEKRRGNVRAREGSEDFITNESESQ